MERKTFETLVNREIDGLLTPEEAARLNDYTTRHPEALAEQQALHRVHQAFQDLDRPECPPDLAGRIADRVLAGPAPVKRFWTSVALQRVAAAILVVVCAGFAGFHIANQSTTATANEPREQQITQWIDSYDVDRETARQIVDTEIEFASDQDVATGKVLAILQKAGKLDAYLRNHALSAQEAGKLMEAAKGR